MSWIMVDVEADGPCPGLYSMVSFGAVVVREDLTDTFYSGVLRPLPDAGFIQEALQVSGITREEMFQGTAPEAAMSNFKDWLKKTSRGNPMFISDNNGFDFQFINYYFRKYLNHNPFGHSSTNLGSLYKGLEHDFFKNFKHLRKTKHTHHPVDDAKGNAEALLYMKRNMGLKIRLE